MCMDTPKATLNADRKEAADIDKLMEDASKILYINLYKQEIFNSLGMRLLTDELFGKMNKAAKELIKEIGILELEVMYLEQYLLFLYWKRFDELVSSLSTKGRRLQSASYINRSTSELSCNDSILDKQRRMELASHINNGTSVVNVRCGISDKEISDPHSSDIVSRSSVGGFQLNECINQLEPESVLDSSIHLCYSTLSQQTACSIKASSENIRSKAAESYHSLPLFMLEQAQCAKCKSTSLAEQFGNSYIDNVSETPNWLFEEMIKCISAI
ncbi:uncharacterized protein LOC123914752 [Trifolium pratense]|uniref:uncharacterized protein LOC123914752 n=1 Tax=Trifolium pratense TaxID=57577 RepID=UPI001E691A83|nr:uncharacterized protein LOC123914752 [Trifolium pratense]